MCVYSHVKLLKLTMGEREREGGRKGEREKERERERERERGKGLNIFWKEKRFEVQKEDSQTLTSVSQGKF